MKNTRDVFHGCTAVLGTKHGKEHVIAPVLGEHLGLHVTVPEHFDSDRFGTFTREVDRAGDQLEAARRKAQAAMDQTGDVLGLASEGSFGPHPTVGFPKHGLVVRRGPDDPRGMTKGIADEATLADAVARRLRKPFARSVFIETDLRAHMNPTRMDTIRDAAIDLVQNALRRCPDCERPGFSIDEVRPGLPCVWCGLPSNAIFCHVSLQPLRHVTEERYPHGFETAKPGQCPFCNP